MVLKQGVLGIRTPDPDTQASGTDPDRDTRVSED